LGELVRKLTEDLLFNYWDLGQQAAVAIVEINLTGSEANVQLLDAANYSAYKGGRRHSYYGAHYRHPRFGSKSPPPGTGSSPSTVEAMQGAELPPSEFWLTFSTSGSGVSPPAGSTIRRA